MPAVRPPLGPCSPAGWAAGGLWPPGRQLPAGQTRSVCVSSSSCGLWISGSRPSQRVSWAGEGAVLGQLDASWNHQVPLTTGCPVPTCRCFREAPGPGPDGKWVGQRPSQLASTISLAPVDALVHPPSCDTWPGPPPSPPGPLLQLWAPGGWSRGRPCSRWGPSGVASVARGETGHWLGKDRGPDLPPLHPGHLPVTSSSGEGTCVPRTEVVLLRCRSDSLIHLEMLAQTALLQPVRLALGGVVLCLHGLSL